MGTARFVDANQITRLQGELEESGTEDFENVAATGFVTAGSYITATGELTGSDLVLTGLTGSVAAGRFVGFTADLAPTTGAHLVGDYALSLTGKVWACTVAGTAGTFIEAGSVTFAPKASPTFTGTVVVPAAAATTSAPRLNQLTSALTVTSGALPNTGAWASGTAKVNPVTRQITVNVEVVFDGTANAATVVIAISSDDSTYTTVGTPGVSAAINTVGGLTMLCPVTLPAGWYIKLTIATHAAVAASIYY